MWLRRILTIFILMCILASSFLIFPAQKTQALSIDDYFVYTYNFTFSKTTVTGSETFYVTVNGQATCIKDLFVPGSWISSTVVSKVVAQHQQTGTEVVLNPNYTISYSGFPDKKGQSISESRDVELSFTNSSPAGSYNVIGQIIEVKATALGITLDFTSSFPSSQAMGSVTYQPLLLGGGGGSTGPNPATNLTRFMDDAGVFIEDAEALSIDKMVKLLFHKGTRFAIPGGIGSTVIIKAVEKGKEPEAPKNAQIIGQAYNLEPDGATFNPPIRMAFSYNETSLPQGAQEKDIFIAWWDVSNSKWVPLKDCIVNETANTVTGSVEHFTMFATIIDVSPSASLDVSSLSINPTSVKTGEPVTITVKATNTGGRAGMLNLILKINGVEEVRESVTLGAGSSETVTFTVVKDIPATYNIDVNGLAGSFTMETLSVPESSSPASNPPSTQPETKPESIPGQELEPVPQTPVVEPFNWGLLGTSVGAGMVFGSIFVFILWRRMRTHRL
jgi:hypothetical protein